MSIDLSGQFQDDQITSAQYFLLSLLPHRYTDRYYEFFICVVRASHFTLFKCSISVPKKMAWQNTNGIAKYKWHAKYGTAKEKWHGKILWHSEGIHLVVGAAGILNNPASVGQPLIKCSSNADDLQVRQFQNTSNLNMSATLVYVAASTNRFSDVADVSPSSSVIAFGSSRLLALWQVDVSLRRKALRI